MLAANLPTLAALAIIGLVFVYIVLDGFDIGVGILLMRETSREDRDAMIDSTAATRFSSEWWLVAAAGAMYGAFPFPFRALALALSIPIIVMVAALALRAFAATRRSASADLGERAWSLTYALASLVVPIAQGFCLGGYLRGLSVADNRFIGGLFDWAGPFSLIVAIALAIGYALLGAAWLAFKSSDRIADRARGWIRPLTIAAFCAMVAISAATLTIHSTVSARWGIGLDGIAWRYFLPLAPLPLAAIACLASVFFTARLPHSPRPFLATLGAFAAAYAGLAVSVWPYVVPYGFTAATSASDAHALTVTLGVLAGAVPCLVIVTFLAYRFMRPNRGGPA